MDAGAIKAGQAFVEVTASYDQLENNLNTAYSKALEAIRRGEAARAAYQLEQQKAAQRQMQIGAEAFAAWERDALREGRAETEKRAADRKAKADMDMAYVERASARMHTLSAAVETVTSAGRSLAVAGGGIVGSLALMVRGFAHTGEDLENMSQRTGIAATALTELNYAAKVTQAGMEGFETGIKRMQKNLGEAVDGSKEAQSAFSDLGLSVSELAGMSPDQQFMRIAASIRSIENPALKTAAVLKIFGKGGTSLLPMINETEQLRQRARDLGLTMSGTQASAGARLNNVFESLAAVVRRLSDEVGSALAPTIESLGTRLESCIGSVIQFVSHNQSAVLAIAGVGGAALAMGTVLGGLGLTIQALSVSYGGLTKAMAALQLVMKAHVATLSATKVTMGLANALAWVTANPVIAGLAAVTAGMAALAAVTSYAYARAHELSEEMTKVREAGDERRTGDLSKAGRLEQLSKKPGLSKEEMNEAGKLIKELTGRYGDFGVEMNRVANSITTAADAFKRLYDAMSRQTTSQLDKEIAEKQTNLSKINDQIADVAKTVNMGASAGPIGHQIQAYGGAASDVKKLEAERERVAKQLIDLQRRRAALNAGDRRAVNRSPSANASVQETEEKMRKEAELAKKNAAMMEDYGRRESQANLQRIQNEHDREMALLKDKWDWEQQKAVREGATKATLDQLQKARDAEIAAKREELARKQYEEQIRWASELADIWASVASTQGEAARMGMDNPHAETMAAIEAEYNAAIAAAQRKYDEEKKVADLKMDSAAAQRAEERLNAELAEAEAKKRLERAREERRIREANKQILEQTQDVALELGIKQAFGMDSSQGGKLLEKAKLELDRQRAVEEAAKRGEDTSSVEKLFSLRKQLLELPEKSISVRGGFSAFGWDRQWSGTVSTDPGGTMKAKADRIINQLAEIILQLRRNGTLNGLQIG